VTGEPAGPERASDRADTSHLDGVEDGCGCAEVWEHLSESRAGTDSGGESDPERGSDPDESREHEEGPGAGGTTVDAGGT